MIEIESECRDQLKRRIPRMFLPKSESGQDTATQASSMPNGIALIALGVILPASTLVASLIITQNSLWHLILKSPIETLIKFALVLSVPLVNQLTLSAIAARVSRHPIRLGILNGATIGTTFIAGVISTVSIVLGYPTNDQFGASHSSEFAIVALTSWISFGVAVFLANQLQLSKETRGARIRTLLYSMLGVLISISLIAGSEARNIFIKISQHLAISDSSADRQRGLNWLRALNSERDLRLECADPTCTGLSGLFFKLDDLVTRQLYFAATGAPYKHSETADISMQSNAYLNKHVVGKPISELSLTRSKLTGFLHPETLTSSLEWTFVFKNKTSGVQEARAEISLPPEAVVSGLTLWIDGEPRKALFAATERIKSASNWIVVDRRDPALISDLGQDKYLLRCSSVPARGELRVMVAITAPLKLESPNESSLILPKLLATNFSILGEQGLRLQSTGKMEANHEKIKASDSVGGQRVLSGTFDSQNISDSNIAVRLKRSSNFTSIAARDPNLQTGDCLVETIKQSAVQVPNHLVIVVDSSQSLRRHRTEIAEALTSLNSKITTYLMIASDDPSIQGLSMPLAEGLKKLEQIDFSGGHDNLQSLIAASEKASETQNSAVLWLHGPQPGFNQEMYIMPPFSAVPSFYDLDVEPGSTNLADLLKNHREIGPFTQVTRTASVGRDLQRLLKKWQPKSKEFTIDISTSNTMQNYRFASSREARELATLWASRRCRKLLANRNLTEASKLAIQYKIVTPVTGAVVLESRAYFNKEELEQSVSKQQSKTGNLLKWITSSTASQTSNENRTITPLILKASHPSKIR